MNEISLEKEEQIDELRHTHFEMYVETFFFFQQRKFNINILNSYQLYVYEQIRSIGNSIKSSK